LALDKKKFIHQALKYSATVLPDEVYSPGIEIFSYGVAR